MRSWCCVCGFCRSGLLVEPCRAVEARPREQGGATARAGRWEAGSRCGGGRREQEPGRWWSTAAARSGWSSGAEAGPASSFASSRESERESESEMENFLIFGMVPQ